jgi:acyl dehydratase
MNIRELEEGSRSISHTYKVTPDVYYSFQRCSNDYNPLHTDALFAKSKGFDKPVMYGNILNAFLSHFVGMLLPTREVMILSQNILFQNPLFLNDEITFESKIDKFSPTVNFIDYKFKFCRIKNDKKVLIANGHIQIKML